MNKNRFFFVLFLATLVGFTSCKKDDKDPISEGETIEFDAKDYTKWVYISFEKGEVIGESEVNETKEGLDWDIAFHRYNVRLNCGESGKGKGGALLVEGKTAKSGWDDVTEAPENGYTVDVKLPVMKEYVMPPKMIETGACPVITGGKGEDYTWVNMKTMGEYTVTDQIFVVKTAKGNYVKIWLKGYVGDDKKGGHITMKYFLQTDGSRNLK